MNTFLLTTICSVTLASSPYEHPFPKSQLTTTTTTTKTITKTETTLTNENLTSRSYLTSIQQRLVHFVRNSVGNLHYTSYKLGGTKIDTSRGIYIVDCSAYVDHILKTVYPNAFSSLVAWSGSVKPTTTDYYRYFTNLYGDNYPYWNPINSVAQLRPGDILVFRKINVFGDETSGHVMVVMDKPVRTANSYNVRVADSAPARHSKDTRQIRRSGIGIGTLKLKVNPETSKPAAYAWQVDSRWVKNVIIAMARPIDVD